MTDGYSKRESEPEFHRMTLEGLAGELGIPLSPLARTEWFDGEDLLQYRVPQKDERDKVLLEVIQHIHNDQLQRSGAARIDAWRKGWGEIMEAVESGEFSYESFCPQYFKLDAVRFHGDYALFKDRLFEFALCHCVKSVLYANYIQDGDRIVDLGTGSAANIYLLLKLFPNSQVVGSDWAEPSVQLVDLISKTFGNRAKGARFDMLSLEGGDDLGPLDESVVLSVHSFEQLGAQWGPVLDMLLEKKPKLCIQIEPVLENYGDNDLLDTLAQLYHSKRGYLEGYKSELLKLKDAGQIEILDDRKLQLGTMLHDPYSILVWRPL